MPEALRIGIAPVTDEERAAWEQQPAGVEVLRDAGAVPYDPEAAEEFYLRTTAEPPVEVNGILGGKPGLKNTTVVSQAQANFTVRLAPGQDPQVVAPEVKRLLHEAAPEVQRWRSRSWRARRVRASSTRIGRGQDRAGCVRDGVRGGRS